MGIKKLQRVGRNYLGQVVYKDEEGRFFLDLDIIASNTPDALYYCTPSDDIDGEPGFPLKEDYEILNPFTAEEIKMQYFKFEYSMLSRLKDDCEAFIGKSGNEEEDKWDCRYHNARNTWGTSIENLIEEMKLLWNKIPEDIKPQWCSAEEIAKLERKAMAVNL